MFQIFKKKERNICLRKEQLYNITTIHMLQNDLCLFKIIMIVVCYCRSAVMLLLSLLLSIFLFCIHFRFAVEKSRWIGSINGEGVVCLESALIGRI